MSTIKGTIERLPQERTASKGRASKERDAGVARAEGKGMEQGQREARTMVGGWGGAWRRTMRDGVRERARKRKRASLR
jgi:hypothetical protein